MLRVTALALVAALFAAPATAGELGVNPTRLVLEGANRSATLRLTNRGSEPTRLQVSAYAWEQERDGRMALSADADLVVYPTLLVLAPGESRMVRVGTRSPAPDLERSWRLFVEELPGPSTDERAVRVLARLGIPVFQPPEDPGPRRVAARVEPGDGGLALVVENQGDTWFMLERVDVKGVDADGRPTVDLSRPGWYLLAGGERAFPLEIDAEACARTAELRVTAETDWGPWTERVRIEGDPCPP